MGLGTCDIRGIVERGAIRTEFQPICSSREKRVRGVEALARGVAADGSVVPPTVLFETARREGALLELDRLCRTCAMQAFKPIHDTQDDLLLFFNFETSLIDMQVVDSGHLRAAVAASGLDPSRVVIEIVESHAQNTAELERFVQIHREAGFLIGLDDVGSGHSNFERIALIRPDFLKIDRALVAGIVGEPYRQELFKSLTNLVHRVGALVVAEGIEDEAQALCSLELGADLLQGFYLARPGAFDDATEQRTRGATLHVAEAFRDHMIRRIVARGAETQVFTRIVAEAIARVAGAPRNECDGILAECVDRHPRLECLYLLDAHSGIQVSNTVVSTRLPIRRSVLFRPAQRGADHSMKEYFFSLLSGLNRFATETYISSASGNRCITVAQPFSTIEGERLVLCADLIPGIYDNEATPAPNAPPAH